MKEYNMTEDMAEHPSVWHTKIKACQLLHGGGILVRKVRKNGLYMSKHFTVH